MQKSSKDNMQKSSKDKSKKVPFKFSMGGKNRFLWRGSATSIYFLLWEIFVALSLVIVLLCTFTQQYVTFKSYNEQASREIAEKGRNIENRLEMGLPDWVGGNYSGYVRMLATEYDVDVYVLDEAGQVLFPRELNFDEEAPEVEDSLDFSDKMEELFLQISQNENAVYASEAGYVYATNVQMFPNVNTYLYVEKSLEFIETVNKLMSVRVVLISVFVFILSFAVTSAVAGWLTDPITEMTKKARRLAQGDFEVDFHGSDYGKEMVELAEALNFARDELSKTDRMQRELIANVSHDFKTPLTMIKGYASMIIEISGDNPEKRNKHAQVIVSEADKLTSLVGDVLDLSKINADMDALKMQKMDVSTCLYETLDRFDYLCETQGYHFVLDIDQGLYTYADERKIGQVLYNLISNAINYTGEDRVVYVRLKKEGEDFFRFSVQDTGKGIPSKELVNIWDRYYRVSEAHKRPIQGTGLGLSIVKAILEKHKFYYGAESEEGKGSTFYVLFPLFSPNA